MDSVVETKDQTGTFVVGRKVAENTSDNQSDITREGMGIGGFEFLDLHIAKEIDNGTDETRLEHTVFIFIVDFGNGFDAEKNAFDGVEGRGHCHAFQEDHQDFIHGHCGLGSA